MARKVTVSILFFAFLFNASGYLNVYHFIYNKKSSSRAQYLKDRQQLKVVTHTGLDGLAQKGYERREEGEYVYDGRWYDVVRTEHQGANIVVYLAHDSYEEELMSFLKSLFRPSAAAQNDPVNAKLTHDLLKQYLPATHYLKPVFRGSFKFLATNILSEIDTPHLEVPSPPPRYVSASH